MSMDWRAYRITTAPCQATDAAARKLPDCAVFLLIPMSSYYHHYESRQAYMILNDLLSFRLLLLKSIDCQTNRMECCHRVRDDSRYHYHQLSCYRFMEMERSSYGTLMLCSLLSIGR
jgi:hypothetical protein